MLRLTARHADAWNTAWYGAPDDRLRAQLAAMSRALAEEGRDPAELTRTIGMLVYDPDAPPPEAEEDEDTAFSGTRDDLAEAIDEYAALGVDHLILLLQPLTEASIDRVAMALAIRSGSH